MLLYGPRRRDGGRLCRSRAAQSAGGFRASG